MSYVLQNLPWFILLIGVLIFFHELGHFLLAKLCNVKVHRFSLGFGPKLLSFTRKDTEYRLSAIPLGGYVKMLGEIPGVQIPEEEKELAFSSKPLWQRAAIVIAGPFFNFVLAFLIYFFMFTGDRTFNDTKIGVVSVGGPAWQAGLRPGDKILAIGGKPVEKWLDLRKLIGSRPDETFSLTYQRENLEYNTQITPQLHQEMNPFKEIEDRGRIGISSNYIKPKIAIVDPESPAAKIGLKTDDVIVKINEVAVGAWHEVRKEFAKIAENSTIKLLVKRGEEQLKFEIVPTKPIPQLPQDIFSTADKPIFYTGIVSKECILTELEKDTPADKAGLQKGDRLLHLAIEKGDGSRKERPIGVWGIDLLAFSGVDARSTFTLKVQRGREILTRTLKLEEREITDELKNKHTVFVFGATNDIDTTGTYNFKRNVGLIESFVEAMNKVAIDTTLLAKGLSMLVTGQLGMDAFGGPIMLFVLAEKTAKRGIMYFLGMMAFISVQLGVLNVLPIPILDGGHLMFFGIEAIRRRPTSLKTREIANLIGLALLLLLMIFVFSNDILRYVLG